VDCAGEEGPTRSAHVHSANQSFSKTRKTNLGPCRRGDKNYAKKDEGFKVKAAGEVLCATPPLFEE